MATAYHYFENNLTKLAYQAFQYGKSSLSLGHKDLSNRLRSWLAPLTDDNIQSIPPDALNQYRQRYEELLQQDWADAEQGIYPTTLLFDTPWDEVLQRYPMLLLDTPQVWARSNNRRFQEFDKDLKTEEYPQYYLRNFHYQTDGYLSDWSANLYDLQVEILFNGCGDPMRRRVLAPLKAGLSSNFADSAHRVLDVACGTGRTLRFLRGTLPEASLYGVDLSPAYLRKANQWLSDLPGELPQLIQANAEQLPYADNYFHGITCVFLFHELPAPVRQIIINQCYRVIEPGGTFIICDSIQKSDRPEFDPMLNNFPIFLHEPFFKNYLEDDLSARLEAAGFTLLDTQIHLASKYWIAKKSI